MDPGRKRRARVVIADDNAIFLEHLGSFLQSHFDVVGRAVDGRELFEVVQRLLPEVVVTDITMPVMDGIEATRRITKRFPDVKVVVVSIHNEPAIIHAAFDAGVSAYVSKVSADVELIPGIEEVLSGRQYCSKM